VRGAPLALLALVLALAGSAPAAATFSTALAYARPQGSGGIFVMERSGRVRLVARDGLAPTWSPDGRRLAFVAGGAGGQSELYVADADGRHRAPLTRSPDADEVTASWAPDGRRLVLERDLRVFVIGADGRDERPLAAGSSPTWSPKSGRIAFVSDRTGAENLYVVEANGRGLRRVTTSDAADSEPAWSPDGTRLAFVSLSAGSTDLYVVDVESRALVRLTQDSSLESSPVWSPAGDSIWFVSDRLGGGPLWSVPARGGVAASLGGPAAVARFRLRPPVSPELRPDLDQKPPADLSVMTVDRGGRPHQLLGFKSATDNLGLGPLSIMAGRPSQVFPTMRAAQRIRLAGGGARTYPRVGSLRYTFSPSHTHWHLMDFQRYELRRAHDHSLVLRDHKSGFCLTDRWAHRVAVLPGSPRRPLFTEYCARSDPHAVFVSQGTSVGYSDVYPSHFHGQNLDVTRVPAGVYELVHRANPRLLLRELRYENDAASRRIRLSWPRGRAAHVPAIRILATCPATEFCPAR
jgi:dipeptidyl aminopeptidase/acylaminoacyl peptidase